MTHKTIQEQAPARAGKPAPAGKAQQPKGRADRKKAIVELTDTDLQAVNSGGAKPGVGSGSNEY
jgi:hypothetical protein